MASAGAWTDTSPSAVLGPRTPGQVLRAALLSALGALLVGGTAAVLLGRLPLNLYDVSFSLDWGRELIHGQPPDVRVVGASTPHPLSILSGAFAALFGTGALTVIAGVLYVAAGTALVALFALGRACRLGAMGVCAALALVVSEPFVLATMGQATVSDLPSLAAVLVALALEVGRPRRGTAPLVMLAAAGLFRPEAWLLSAMYLLWVSPGRSWSARARLGALALTGPLLWGITDLLLTGNALYSLTYTRASTLLAQRPTGFRNFPGVLWSTLTSYLSTPILVGAFLGLAIDLRARRLPRLIPVTLVLTVVGFAGLGAANLPLDDRYTLPTTLLLAIYFGYFLAGWRRQKRGWIRRGWIGAALVVALLAMAATPADLRALSRDRAQLTAQAQVPAKLSMLLRDRSLRAQIAACGPVQASYRIMPLLAYDLGRSPRTVVVVDRGVPTAGTVIEPTAGLAETMFETHSHPVSSLSRRGYELVAANDSWLIYTRCA